MMTNTHDMTPSRTRTAIVAVAGAKGGVGKSTIAYELAAFLDAVLIDLDWDTGGVSDFWGAKESRRIVDALERPAPRPPRPLRAARRPDLVPTHPLLSEIQLNADELADLIDAWRAAWDRQVVIDTHPGTSRLGDAALAIADLVVCPILFEPKPLNSLKGMLEERPDHPWVFVPNMVGAVPPKSMVERVRTLLDGRPVASPVSRHAVLARRVRPGAVVLERAPGRALARAQDELRTMAAEIVGLLESLPEAPDEP